MKRAETEDYPYQAKILVMDKLELLEEMVRFQEERSQRGHLNLQMMIRGKILFRALEQNAETHALKTLTKSYRKHLELEMKEFLASGIVNAD